MDDAHKRHLDNFKQYGYEVLVSYNKRRQLDAILAYLEDVGEGEIHLKVKNHKYRFIDIPTSVAVDEDNQSPKNNVRP